MADLKDKLTTKQQQQLAAKNPQMQFEDVIAKQLSTQFKTIQNLVPKHVTPERLCRIGLNAISRNPQLMNCSPETIVGSIVNCASLGLEPNLLGHAYIVPFWNSKTKKMEAQFSIGYKGALELIRRTGQVSTISAHEVYEGDKFEYSYGLEDKLIHVPCGEDDESKITHFYACYKLKDGGTGFVVMSKKQIDKHRDKFTKSKTKEGEIFGTWKDHYVAMGLKTTILKLAKYMPISIEQQESQQAMEALSNDNTVMKVKNTDHLGFGEAYIEPNYIVNDESEYKEEFEGTPLE